MEIAIVGFLIFFAYAAADLFRRTLIPDVLMLVLLGVIIGPILNIAKPSDFGVVGTHMGTIALVVLLFHGGSTLNVKSIIASWRTTAALTLTAFFTAFVTISSGGYFLFGLPLFSATILGAICGGTSSAVVIPLVQGLALDKKTETVLLLESAFTDVLSIVLVFALIGAAQTGGSITVNLFSSVATTLLFSPLIGVLAGFAWTAIGVRSKGERLEPLAAMALAFIVYGVTNALGLSGGLAVLVFGFASQNVKIFGFDRVITALRFREFGKLNKSEDLFFAGIIFILKTFFFVYLGLSMYLPRNVEGYVPLIVLMVYFLRLFAVRLTAVPPMGLRDASIASVMAPKGLAAAVLAAVPLQAGITGGEIIRDRTYLLVLVSIVITAVAIPVIEKGILSFLFSPLLGIRRNVPYQDGE